MRAIDLASDATTEALLKQLNQQVSRDTNLTAEIALYNICCKNIMSIFQL